MSEGRPGEGKAVSSAEAKLELGRTSFRRVSRDHVGNNEHRGTEQLAGKRLGEGKGPTDLEKQILFNENPQALKTYRGAGMSDEAIYEILKDQ